MFVQFVILLSPPPLTKSSTAPSPRTPEVTWRHARTRHGGGSAAHPAHKFNGSRYPGRTVTTPLSHWLAARELASHWLPPTQFPPMTQQLPNYLKNARWKVRRSLVVLFRSFGQPRSVNMPWTWTPNVCEIQARHCHFLEIACCQNRLKKGRGGSSGWNWSWRSWNWSHWSLKTWCSITSFEFLLSFPSYYAHSFFYSPRVSGGKTRFKPTSEQKTS